jgi:hypothetical protein
MQTGLARLKQRALLEFRNGNRKLIDAHFAGRLLGGRWLTKSDVRHRLARDSSTIAVLPAEGNRHD